MALFDKVGCNIGSNTTVTVCVGPATIVWRTGDDCSTVRALEGGSIMPRGDSQRSENYYLWQRVYCSLGVFQIRSITES